MQAANLVCTRALGGLGREGQSGWRVCQASWWDGQPGGSCEPQGDPPWASGF